MDDQTPATKGDVHIVETKLQTSFYALKGDIHELKGDINELKRALKEIDKRFLRMNQGIDQVLTVVVNMNNRLTPTMENHEERITKLEKVALR